MTAAGTGKTQCWLQAVSGCYLSVCLLPIPRTPQSTCCELRFIQLVTLSQFLSLSTVHCYTLPTSALAKTLPLCAIPPPRPRGCPLWMTPVWSSWVVECVLLMGERGHFCFSAYQLRFNASHSVLLHMVLLSTTIRTNSTVIQF